LRQAEIGVRAQEAQTEAQNRAADRNADLQMEQIRLQREQVIHQQGLHSEHALQDKQHAHEKEMHQGDLAAQAESAKNSGKKE